MPTIIKSTTLIALVVLLAACSTATDQRHSVALNDATSGEGHWPVEGWDTATLATASKADYLNPRERELVLHLNMVRSDPARYAKEFIAPRLNYYSGNIYRPPWTPSQFGGTMTNEGVAALKEAIAELSSASPVPLLQVSRGISRAARDHAQDQSRSGDTGHISGDGKALPERLNKYGRWRYRIAENVAYGRSAAVDNVVGLLVDDGVPSRSHRKTILNPDFKLVGVAVASHPQYGNLCVMDFAGAFIEK